MIYPVDFKGGEVVIEEYEDFSDELFLYVLYENGHYIEGKYLNGVYFLEVKKGNKVVKQVQVKRREKLTSDIQSCVYYVFYWDKV